MELYYQLGPYCDADVCRLDLLEALLEEPFFDSLRTKQQLGYSVSCGARNTYGVLGFAFQVTSSSHSVANIQAAILAFVIAVPATLRSVHKDDFLDTLASLVNEKTAPDLCLADASDVNWEEISDRRYDFAARGRHAEMLREELRAAGREGLAGFCCDFLLAEGRRVLSVQVRGGG